MPKKYTEQETINNIKNFNDKIAKLYQKNFVNHSGTTKDTKKPYADVLAKWMLDNDTKAKLDSISVIPHKNSYKKDSHTGNIEKITNRVEERIAKELFNEKHFKIGDIFDYQVPLKNTQSDSGVGKIDLVSYDVAKNCVYLLELKRDDNTESLLRCVLEIYTYFRQVDRSKFIESYKLPADVKFVPAVLVFQGSSQDQEHKSSDCKHLQKFMNLLGIKFFMVKPTYAILGDAD